MALPRCSPELGPRQSGDIAWIVAFLASDDAYWLSGEQLYAAGGMRWASYDAAAAHLSASSADPGLRLLPRRCQQ